MKKGFTLIELLVVISIIGLLSSVIIASMSSARKKGNDAFIKSQLNSIRNIASLYYTNYGSYTTNFPASGNGPLYCGSNIGILATGFFNDPAGPSSVFRSIAWNEVFSTSKGGDIKCGGTTDSWAVWGKLSDATYWCVDNTGAGKVNATLPTIASGSTFKCQ